MRSQDADIGKQDFYGKVERSGFRGKWKFADLAGFEQNQLRQRIDMYLPCRYIHLVDWRNRKVTKKGKVTADELEIIKAKARALLG